MCESTVYSTKGEKIMEDVISIKIDNEEIELVDILNKKRKLKGKVVEIDLEKHRILLES